MWTQTGLGGFGGFSFWQLALDGEAVNLEIDADNLAAAVLPMAAGALAELGEAHVGELAEFNPGCDQDGIHIDAVLAFELKEHADESAVAGSAAKDPAAVAEDRAGKRRDQSCRIIHGGCFHLQRPVGAHLDVG